MPVMIQEIKKSIKNPARLFTHQEKTRKAYKDFCKLILSNKLKKRNQLIKLLPDTNPELLLSPEQGYKIIPSHLRFDTLKPLIQRCQKIVEQPGTTLKKESKPFREHLVTPTNLVNYPELTDFALHPPLLSIVANYLGELPLLNSIFLWHDRPSQDDLKASQLYHCDHDDVRQFKVFVFISDIDSTSGPFTLIPTHISSEIRGKLQYDWQYVDDQKMKQHIPPGAEIQLTGPAGTVAFVDTSQVFHFGSRLTDKERIMAVFQYISLTNFLFNPFHRFSPYPYAHLAKPEDSEVVKAVLNPDYD